MNDDSLLKLIQEKDMYKQKAQDYKDTLLSIKSSFMSVGGPLNDNVLNFNYKQLVYLSNIKKQIRMVLWV